MANRYTELSFQNKNLKITVSNNRLSEDGHNSKIFLMIKFYCGDTMYFVDKFKLEKIDDDDKDTLEYCTYINSIDDEIICELIKVYFKEPEQTTTLFITISCGTTKYDPTPAEILKKKPVGYILTQQNNIYSYYEIPKLTCISDLITRMKPFERMFFVY
jgi:hypothetical protein